MGKLPNRNNKINTMSDFLTEWYVARTDYKKSVRWFLHAENLDKVISYDDYKGIVEGKALLPRTLIPAFVSASPFMITKKKLIEVMDTTEKKFPFARKIEVNHENLLEFNHLSTTAVRQQIRDRRWHLEKRNVDTSNMSGYEILEEGRREFFSHDEDLKKARDAIGDKKYRMKKAGIDVANMSYEDVEKYPGFDKNKNPMTSEEVFERDVAYNRKRRLIARGLYKEGMTYEEIMAIPPLVKMKRKEYTPEQNEERIRHRKEVRRQKDKRAAERRKAKLLATRAAGVQKENSAQKKNSVQNNNGGR